MSDTPLTSMAYLSHHHHRKIETSSTTTLRVSTTSLKQMHCSSIGSCHLFRVSFVRERERDCQCHQGLVPAQFGIEVNAIVMDRFGQGVGSRHRHLRCTSATKLLSEGLSGRDRVRGHRGRSMSTPKPSQRWTTLHLFPNLKVRPHSRHIGKHEPKNSRSITNLLASTSSPIARAGRVFSAFARWFEWSSYHAVFSSQTKRQRTPNSNAHGVCAGPRHHPNGKHERSGPKMARRRKRRRRFSCVQDHSAGAQHDRRPSEVPSSVHAASLV